MQKARRVFLAVAGRVLFIGFSIQIVLGIVWMLRNFTSVQQFGETTLLVEIGRNFICDEYEAILYPILILLARGIEKVFLIPYHCILYLVQLAAAGFAGYRLLSVPPKVKKWFALWGSLAIMTFPMAMQCHLAVLPESLIGSCLLLELAFFAEALREGRELRPRQFAKVLGCWLGLALLRPEYLFLGAVPVVILFLYGKKKLLHNFLLMAAFFGVIVSVGKLVTVPGYYGRVQQSFEFSMVSRCAWSKMNRTYGAWPEELQQMFTQKQAHQIDFNAGKMGETFGIPVEEAVGAEHARELFREVTKAAWQNYKRNIVHDVAWDAVGYAFPAPTIQKQFEGRGYDSYSGRNYEIMRLEAPKLTGYYLNYGCWWFMAAMVVGAMMCLLTIKDCIGKWLLVSGCLLTAAGSVIWYTLQGAGIMDYKKTIAVTALWIWWMLASCQKGLWQETGTKDIS